MPYKKSKIIVLILLLACVRGFENQLFYDPFLEYFKENFEAIPIPTFDGFKLFLGLFLRYFINSALSLAVIYVLFEKAERVKFTAILYVFFFFVLVSIFFWAIYVVDKPNPFLLFYIRRFIIQPIFLLLFVPGFYYQDQVEKK
jgi:exosortase F-associated protein